MFQFSPAASKELHESSHTGEQNEKEKHANAQKTFYLNNVSPYMKHCYNK